MHINSEGGIHINADEAIFVDDCAAVAMYYDSWNSRSYSGKARLVLGCIWDPLPNANLNISDGPGFLLGVRYSAPFQPSASRQKEQIYGR
jgi:hypothetical protein